MEGIVDVAKKLPGWVIITIIFYILGLSTYGILMNRTVEFWPPKVYSNNKAGSSESDEGYNNKDYVTSFLNAISQPVIIYSKPEQAGGIEVYTANEAALSFYNIELDQIIGKQPADLHVYVSNYLSNFDSWTAEQMRRISKTNKQNSGTLGSTSVPMMLNANHPHFDGAWELESNYLNIRSDTFIVTVFSKVRDSDFSQ